MRILELFAGIGACSKALERIGIDVEIVDAVEIDKYAIKSFNAIHGTDFEVQDIKEWDKDLKDIDLITHGSPCQDFSVAGKQAGGDLGSGTRSSLMYETIRIVGKVRPKYVLWENVKNLLSKKHKHNFDAYVETMNVLGYNSYYQVLNAKDYGVPQNRERVYTISIRKDIDKGIFKFPEKEQLQLRLKDMLENEVDEKYYLSKDKFSKIQVNNYEDKNAELMRIGGMYGQTTRWGLYDEKGISPTLVAAMGEGGGYVPMVSRIGGIFDTEAVKENHSTVTATNVLKSKDKRLCSLVNKTNFEEGKVLNMDLYNQTTNENISQCLTEPHHNTQRLFDGYRIRKLTPKECWRLMGFDDEDFEKAAGVPTSNTQLYKQAGNSIVVNVLEKIFKNLF